MNVQRCNATSNAVNYCWQDKCDCMSLEMTGYSTQYSQMELNTKSLPKLFITH